VATVDVIIVNWNDRTRTPAAIDSLLALGEVAHELGFVHIVVSDNGSTDGSLPLLRERFGERITIVENGANLGFGAGVNRAVPAGTAPFIFLLNPDASVRDGALQELVSFMQQRPRCAIAGPKIYEEDGSLAGSCGEFDSWSGAFLRSSAWGEWPPLRRYANGASLREWDYHSPRRVDLVIGAALMIRRNVLERVGLFDERFFMYHEEVDLAKRVAEAGYEVWYVPSAEATHAGQGSSGGKNVERYKRESRRKYWVKHYGLMWYYSLSAALAARYVLYAGALVGSALLARRLLAR